jgi:hypothetical protein
MLADFFNMLLDRAAPFCKAGEGGDKRVLDFLTWHIYKVPKIIGI